MCGIKRKIYDLDNLVQQIYEDTGYEPKIFPKENKKCDI
jgi:hypothetical protein